MRSRKRRSHIARPSDPATLAPDADLCHCGAPRPACARCDGDGGWFDGEGDPVRCDACFGHRSTCPNPACGGSAQKEDSHAPR